MCKLKITLSAPKSTPLQKYNFSFCHQKYLTLTSHTPSVKYALCNSLWELLNSEVPSNVCLQDSNCFALMIVTV